MAKSTGKDLISETLKEHGFLPPPNPSAAEIQIGILLLILKELKKK